MKSLKEQLDDFDWEDEEYVDDRGDIEYDDYSDGNVEGTGDVPSETHEDEDYLDSYGLTSHDEDVEDWFNGLQNMDDEYKDEAEGDEADQWLSAHESLESLNAKEAKLREALHAVRNAKLKLSK